MKTGDDVRGEHQQDLDRKTNNNKDDISSDNDKKIDKKNEKLDAKQENINELKKNNVALREEASKYQSALGVAANFRISDDKNHSVQLKNDILSLQDAIEDYVTNLKGNVEVNIENVEKLAQKYGCLTNIITEKTKRQNKSFIKAVLQRYVLEVIITNANDYFDYLENTDTLHLESEILMKTNDLCLKLDKFSETRTGTDKITSTSSIKIRQEAYAALTKKQSVENMATNIIREFIRLFWFRLNVQEPIITIAWFGPSTKIDRGTMKGRWEEEYDDVDNLIVDLCYFPIIGLNLEDPSERKLYTRAKVFPRCQGRNYAISLFEKMVKNVTPSDRSESQQAGHGSNEASNHEDSYQNRK
ncbi:unnamed protein product [Rhizophagus irregularis]|nr:unnamed protein product [Rhizophagus irregularis]